MSLSWIGNLETCDLCGDEFPMSWIVYTGKQFLCYACLYPVTPNQDCYPGPIASPNSLEDMVSALKPEIR